jgi:hypothetical protein
VVAVVVIVVVVVVARLCRGQHPRQCKFRRHPQRRRVDSR